ncbi:transporter substrate-binding domain-containing protein [Rheinheimera baltica]|nr:transporter substrate-binding domain-containing protein [Rheinheimera baltica]
MRFYMMLIIAVSVFLLSCKPAEQAQTVVPQSVTGNDAVVKTNCELTFGMDAWEPYQYMSVGNKAAGLDVELVEAITSSMGCDLNVVQGSWVELLSLLKNGDVDFVLGASKTQERESFAYFSEPYRQERFQLYVRKNAEHPAYADLKAFVDAGHKVGVVNEYYYGDEVVALYADETRRTQFVGAIISELNMARLLDEEIDGLLEDSFVGASILRRKGLDKYIQPHSISLGQSDVFVMFSKASVQEDQVQQFNVGLAQLRADGRYNRIVEKYSH